MVNDDRTVYKSAVTGEFVTKEFAEANPDTTFATTIEVVDDVEVEDPIPDLPNDGINLPEDQ